jgi:DNA-binding response OmpR family regulator
MRLLIVEDNDQLAELLAQGLKAAGFETDRTALLTEAQDALAVNSYAGVVLDLGLPDGDGKQLVAGLRAKGDATPILMLTARGTVAEKVRGLSSGADDYLVKPFAFEELIARLRALMRRPGTYAGDLLEAGNIGFDTGARQAFVGGVPQTLSARELALLELLIRRPGRVVPKRLAEDQLFGLSCEVRSNAVEVYVHRLRKQLVQAGATAEVHTVRGVGYILVEAKG